MIARKPSAPGAGDRSSGRTVSSLGWSMGSQVFATLSNVAISLLIARVGGAEGLGVFQLAFAVYVVVLGFSRQLISEPLLVDGGPGWMGDRSAITLALTFGAAWAVLLTLGLTLLSEGRFWWLTLAVPLLLAQDTARYSMFRRGLAHEAAWLDGLWLLVVGVGAPAVISQDGHARLLVWALGGAVGGLVGMTRVGLTSFGSSVGWWRSRASRLGRNLGMAGLAFHLGSQGLMFGIAGVGGPGALGELRAAMMYFGPAQMILAAAGTVLLPQMAQRKAETRSTRVAWAVMVGASVLAILMWCMAGQLWQLLFGTRVRLDPWLLCLVGVSTVLLGASWVFGLVMRSESRGDQLVKVYFAAYVGTLPLGLALVVGQVRAGAAWALVVQSLVVWVGSWCVVRRHSGGLA